MNQVSKIGLPGSFYRLVRKPALYFLIIGILIVITGSIIHSKSSHYSISKSGKEELVKLALEWEKQYATPPTEKQIEELVASYPDESKINREEAVLSWETLK